MGGGGGGAWPSIQYDWLQLHQAGTVLSLRMIYQGSKTEFFSSDMFVKMSMAEL